MAGIIEKIAHTQITIKQEVGISDGKTVWGNDISAVAFIMGFQQSDISLYGTIQNGKVFLVSPTQREPRLPAIEHMRYSNPLLDSYAEMHRMSSRM
jgi:hypothetical protein